MATQRRFHRRPGLLATILLGFGMGSVAATELPTCSRPFSLAFHVHGLLFDRNSGVGIDHDVAQELIRRSGCKFKLSVMPRARIWREIESGQLDFSMSGITSDSRDRFASFAWYLYNKYDFLVRLDAGVDSLVAFEARQDLVIGGVRSFRYSATANALVDRLTPLGRYVEVADHEQLLSMLERGRIHAMIIEPFNYTQVDRRRLTSITRRLEIGDPPVLHGLIMSRESIPPDEQLRWQALVESMRKDGTLLKIMRRYFPPAEALEMLRF